MTGRHRGLKRKLRAGYRAVSRMSHVAMRFSSSSVVSHTFCALCVHSKFGHHPHPLGYLFAKFRFFCGLNCWAGPRRKIAYSITQSLSLFDAPGTEAFASEYHYQHFLENMTNNLGCLLCTSQPHKHSCGQQQWMLHWHYHFSYTTYHDSTRVVPVSAEDRKGNVKLASIRLHSV